MPPLSALRPPPPGRVVNLMSADVAKIADFLYPQLTFISAAPLAVTVALIMLWFQIGWATLVGLAVLLLSTPVSNIAVRATQIGQFLVGVRVIKMYHWERPQQTEIENCRAEELRALRNMIPSKVAMQTLLYVLPQLAGVLSFLAVGLTNPEALTPATAFSSLVLFQIMRFPLLTLSTGLVELGAAIISARRITSFMAAQEQLDYVTRLQQPAGTTAASPPRTSRRPSSSAMAASLPGAAAEGGLQPSGDGACTRARSVSGSGMAQPPSRADSQSAAPPLLRPSTSAPHPGLQGVEPGLTVAAARFRWTAAAAAQHRQEQERERERERERAGGSAVVGRGGSLRRVRSSARPLMEVVDAAGESLSSGAVALGARLTRAFTRRRDIDATAPALTPRGGSPATTPRGAAAAEPGRQLSLGLSGGGGGSTDGGGGGARGNRSSSLLSPRSRLGSEGGGHKAGGDDEERVGLLGGGGGKARSDERAAPASRVELSGGGGGGTVSVMVAFDSSSSGPGSEEGGGGGGDGADAKAAAARRDSGECGPSHGGAVASGGFELLDIDLRACALGPDLALMPAGRDTEIGEKGLNLSGGQKQRLALARAMYQVPGRAPQEADLYLLDDPLSAVDVHVGATIYNLMIRGALRGAAVLLVTNGVQYLPAADRVVVMDAGRIVVQGTYSECLAEPLFSSLLEEFRAEQQQQPDEGEGEGQERGPAAGAGAGTGCGGRWAQHHPLSENSLQPPAPVTQPYPSAFLSASALPSAPAALPHPHPHPAGGLAGGLAERRASVEAVRAAQRASLEAALAPGGGPLRHVADLDEGAEGLDSLRRMSGDGGAPGSPERRGGGGGKGGRGGEEGERRPLLGKGTAGSAEAVVAAPQAKVAVEGKGCDDAKGAAKAAGVGSAPPPQPSPAGVSAAAARRGRITAAEDRELGQVKMRVYGAYFRAFHPAAAVAMVLFWSAEQGTRLATNAWLAHWSRTAGGAGAAAAGGGGGRGTGLGRFSGVYLALGGAYAAATFFRSTTNNLGSYRASKLIHGSTLTALVAAPLAFFESTPVGRILNRLSRDVDEMDYNLALYQQQLGNCVMRLLATILFLCILQPAFTGEPRGKGRTSIELQRIDSVSRSPVYANFAETMTGLDTIRAFRMQERFKARHEAMVDTNATAYYNARVADEWLSIRWGGRWGSMGRRRVSALVESRYNAVERLLAYAALEPEEGRASRGSPPPHRPAGLPAWPATGELEFRDVWMSYRPGLDPVLKGVSFRVLDGQKVGIVGRTGSGKSSLIVALFRLVEPLSGAMLLDGVDLRSLRLGTARTALSAIPQEPVLFAGSVRSNLDPWGQHGDAELWAALGVVALREHVRGMGGLSAAVSEGGSNFSVGQRQLVCVARALLRQPRLLVADEATASVDPETDGLIQRALRTHFKSSSVLTIAHRLNTILDSDAVLLMDAGRVAEFGPVPQLLATRGSAFAAMVRDAGLAATDDADEAEAGAGSRP
ncbi:hypothetical protein GPECTOR_17g973 [Gonium pectorale]|uniref:ABC transporter domain-containing protein n=1 Tax=Gonium pectorale TaxID=33097 RepID=A0A150GKJ8_GONPE|nr:hypothetical protein GPECTOR_17g973 [Gonium pectorale]|eukprot:KXZ50332.1 hypothetical protein GPECTOR_17g973 [Gonium pectorale]